MAWLIASALNCNLFQHALHSRYEGWEATEGDCNARDALRLNTMLLYLLLYLLLQLWRAEHWRHNNFKEGEHDFILARLDHHMLGILAVHTPRNIEPDESVKIGLNNFSLLLLIRIRISHFLTSKVNTMGNMQVAFYFYHCPTANTIFKWG